MALDPLDPFAPPVLTDEGQPRTPWSWVPPEWEQMTAPAPQMQPGLGVPQDAIDAAAAQIQQPEIEMPAMEMRAPEPFIGFPRLVEEPARELPPPMPEPDAVSGVGEIPASPMQPGMGIPQSVIDQAVGVDPLTGEPQVAPASAETPQQTAPQADSQRSLASMSGEEFRAFNAEAEETKRANAAAAMLEAATARQRGAIEDAEILRSSQEAARRELDQVKTEAAQLANERVDADGWMDEGGPGRVISSMIAGALGGLVQHLNGGRNIGLDAVNQSIERYIATKQADRQHKRAALGDRRQAAQSEMAQAADDFRQAAVIRSAALESAVQMIEAEQMNYDPAGTKARNLEKDRRLYIAEKEAAETAYAMQVAKLTAEQQKAELERQKAVLAVREQAEKERHNRKSEALEGWKTSIDKKDKAEGRQLQREGLVLEAEKLRKQGQNKEAELLLERGISGTPVVSTDENGIPTVKYERLKNRDGSDFIPTGSVASVDKLRAGKIGADQMVQILDEVEALGPEWLSNTANSDKLQKIRTAWGAAKMAAKDFLELGVIAGPDMELVDNFLGTGDPTGYKNSTAARAQARKNIIRGANLKLQGHGFDGEWDPPDLGTLDGPKKSPDEEAIKGLLEAPTLTKHLDEGNKSIESAGKASVTLLPSQRAMLDRLTETAIGADRRLTESDRRDAATKLGQIVDNTASDTVRQAALEALRRIGQSAETPSELEPVRSVARDSIAGEP